MTTAIDLFSGAGGFSTGAQMAGVKVLWAADHWKEAVNTHAANHPYAKHVCQDLHQANWMDAPRSDIVLASPCCQGHSKARGKANGNPQHDASRSTAWAVVSVLEAHSPELAVVENVIEFMQWALFPAWCAALTALGYAIAPHVIDAADHGVPQNRVRLYLVISKSKHPIQLDFDKQDHVPADMFINWSAGTKWSRIDREGRSKATLSRIENGRRAHGQRFLTAYYGNEYGGRGLNRPIGTITTRDRWAVIDGDQMRMLSAQECRAAMGFPDDYQLPENHKLAVHMLGNAVCPPVARNVITALLEAA